MSSHSTQLTMIQYHICQFLTRPWRCLSTFWFKGSCFVPLAWLNPAETFCHGWMSLSIHRNQFQPSNGRMSCTQIGRFASDFIFSWQSCLGLRPWTLFWFSWAWFSLSLFGKIWIWDFWVFFQKLIRQPSKHSWEFFHLY